jgi:hypothetical protein
MAEVINDKGKKQILPIQEPLTSEELAEFTRLQLTQARIYQLMFNGAYALTQRTDIKEYIR